MMAHDDNNNNTIIHFIETRLQDIQWAQQQKIHMAWLTGLQIIW